MEQSEINEKLSLEDVELYALSDCIHNLTAAFEDSGVEDIDLMSNMVKLFIATKPARANEALALLTAFTKAKHAYSRVNFELSVIMEKVDKVCDEL